MQRIVYPLNVLKFFLVYQCKHCYEVLVVAAAVVVVVAVVVVLAVVKVRVYIEGFGPEWYISTIHHA